MNNLITSKTELTRVQQFVSSHRADDIVYALQNPQFFGLTLDDEIMELHSFVFAAIRAAKGEAV